MDNTAVKLDCLDVARDRARDVALLLACALDEDDRDTAAPSAAVAVIDETFVTLHRLRDRCVAESRRRKDAAMERSAALLARGDRR